LYGKNNVSAGSDADLGLFVDVLGVQTDREFAAGDHCISGIHGKVQQSHFQLVWIDVNGGHRAFRNKLDTNQRTYGPLDEAHHILHKGLDICGLRLEFLLAGKGEQPLGQSRAATRAFHGAIQEPVKPRILPQLFGKKIEVSEDRHKQVIEIVRNTAD
jgi:hypothetical protein